MKQTTLFAKLVLLLVLVGALALAGCGGDDGLSAEDQARIADAEAAAAAAAAEQAAAEEAARLAAEKAAEEEAARLAAEEAARQAAQAETARLGRIEAARTAIAAAATAEAAQMAYDAVKDEATATESAALMQAVADRTAALALMDSRTQQMMALAAAAANVDVTAFDLTTDAGIAAAEALLAALEMALDAATDVSDADKAMYQSQFNAASLPVMTARAESDRMGRIAAAMTAIAMAATMEDAQMAFDDVADEATLTEAQALQQALDMRATELATMDRANQQMMALSTAAGNVDLSDLSTQDAVNAASTAIAALEVALAAAVDVSDANKATYQATVDAGKMAVMTAQGVLDHASQTMALSNAVMDLNAIDLGNLTTQGAIDDAQAAIDALQAALDAATELSDAEKAAALADLATATRTVLMAQGRVDIAGQMAALTAAVTALDAIDLDNLMTQDQIDAANKAIVTLELALEAAADVTDPQKVDATVDVTLAKRKVMAAQTALDENIDTQKMALTTAGDALGMIDLTDLSDQANIDAANTAIADLQAALDGATHVDDADKSMYQTQLDTATETVRMVETGMDLSGRIASHRSAITNAVAMAQAAVGKVNDTASDEDVTDADNAIAGLEQVIAAAAVDLPDGDIDLAMANGALAVLKPVLDVAKDSRTKAMAEAMAEAEKMRNEMMEETAAKLFAGISAQSGAGDGVTFSADDRDAFYNTAGDAILVVIGDGTTPPTAATATLSEDEDTMVADNHGWEGKRYTDPAGGDMYEAVVYSNVGDPTMGLKFGSAAAVADPPTGDFQYQLTEGELANSVLTANPARIDFTGITRTAGMETFELPDPNTGNAQDIFAPGTFHGVPGNYICDTGAGRDAACSATVAADGFTLTSNWTFKPGDPNARVTEMDDGDYASYGWWLLKEDNDGDFTASAFVDEMGTVAAATGLDRLNGTAKYMGGAAGKYALRSSTGGTNDAGHFTARAMLEANFTNNTAATAITGTIDMFIGADGESRDWSVKLNGSDIGDDGGIGNAGDGTDNVATVWTIGGAAADASGNWTGTLRNNGTDLVPQVATGTFYSEYNGAGRMVGAFGVNKQ